jgi:DNA-binding response OmpR family regulator
LVLNGDTPPPPQSVSCVEDWVRLPIDDSDVQARLATLRLRAQRHPARPVVEPWGQLSYEGRSEILSPIDHAITEKLVAHFDAAVNEQQLVEHAWPHGDGTATALRVHIYRIRKRIAPLGLSISSLRGRGYIMTARTGTAKTGTETIS